MASTQYWEKIVLHTIRNSHNFYTPAVAANNSHPALQAPELRSPTLRGLCHLRSADLQPLSLIKLQFQDRLCIRTRTRTRGVEQLIHARAYGVLHFSHHDACHPIQVACISDLFNHKLDKSVPHFYHLQRQL